MELPHAKEIKFYTLLSLIAVAGLFLASCAAEKRNYTLEAAQTIVASQKIQLTEDQATLFEDAAFVEIQKMEPPVMRQYPGIIIIRALSAAKAALSSQGGCNQPGQEVREAMNGAFSGQQDSYAPVEIVEVVTKVAVEACKQAE